ncbi:glycosyltransferase, partial [Nitriliruptoraceae bacterium ZYF776]|nr:glycosyltransferase [Profundirhabdus halotolerans]
MTDAFPVLVGWDSREDIAYQVCRHSLLKRSSVPVAVEPIRQPDLRRAGLYTRDADPLASTEFTYTRFLVPHLRGFRGWALFVDCDFLWLDDI